jgi:hypothetical protein
MLMPQKGRPWLTENAEVEEVRENDIYYCRSGIATARKDYLTVVIRDNPCHMSHVSSIAFPL